MNLLLLSEYTPFHLKGVLRLISSKIKNAVLGLCLDSCTGARLMVNVMRDAGKETYTVN